MYSMIHIGAVYYNTGPMSINFHAANNVYIIKNILLINNYQFEYILKFIFIFIIIINSLLYILK